MFYVYIIIGKNNYLYTGCTNNLKKRFHEHNIGDVVATKPYKPFILIYYEACLNNKDAYIREKYLKSRLGKNYLRKRLKNWYNIAKACTFALTKVEPAIQVIDDFIFRQPADTAKVHAEVTKVVTVPV